MKPGNAGFPESDLKSVSRESVPAADCLSHAARMSVSRHAALSQRSAQLAAKARFSEPCRPCDNIHGVGPRSHNQISKLLVPCSGKGIFA